MNDFRCHECGKTFQANKSRQAMFCSNACKQKAYRDRYRSEKQELLQEIRRLKKKLAELGL